MFLEAGGGAARRAQPAAAGFACGFALRAKSGAAVVGRWQRAAVGRRQRAACGGRWQRAAADGDGSGLLRTGTAAGCCGRGRQRAAADGDGRQAGRRSRTPPRRGGGPAGRIAAGRSGPPPQKTRPGKPQFSGPGLVLIDSPCARSGGVFPPGSGQGRWYRRGSW